MNPVVTGALLAIALAVSGAAVADQVKLDVSTRDPQCVRECTGQYAQCSPKQVGETTATAHAINACKEVLIVCLQSCPEDKKRKK